MCRIPAAGNAMSSGKLNCIAILDAIPNGELNTARRLYEDIQDISAYHAAGLEVRYFRIDTISDIDAAAGSLISEAESNSLKPWLHLEGHGLDNQSGFSTASGSPCGWVVLKDIITPLNTATDFNLILILATCFGGSFARSIRVTDRAPVLGLIGPTREIESGEVEIDFPEFYKTFFREDSLKEALRALTARADAGLYYRTNAKQFFLDVWAGYKNNQCTDEEIDKRARALYRKAKKERSIPTPSIGKLKRAIRGGERDFFDRYRDKYFMYDRNQNNRTRFLVTYEEAEKYTASRL